MLNISEITDPTGDIYCITDLSTSEVTELGNYQLIRDEAGKDSKLLQKQSDIIRDTLPYRLLAGTTGADTYECRELLIIIGTGVASHNSITNASFFLLEIIPVHTERPGAVPPHPSQEPGFSRRKQEIAALASSLRNSSNLDIESLAQIFKVSRATYHRWLKGLPISKRHRDHLLEIQLLIEEAAQRLGSPEAVSTWLLTPVSPGGKKPIEYLATKQYDLFRGFLLHQHTGKEQFRPLKPSRRLFKPRRREEIEDVREQLRPHTWYEDDAAIARRFRQWLGRRYLRQALANEIVMAVQQPVVKAIRQLSAKDPLHNTLDNLREIRFFLLNDAVPYEIEMLFLFDGDSENSPLTDEETARLANWIDRALKHGGRVASFTWHMYSTQEISVHDYENAYELALHEFTLP
ncbi:MAG TPA: hypothetical protein VKY19_15035 [Ktedonosporobacter sp.]|jgi:transcriptional regulator with XRE-family HTH domain|nr:hypothetical protein [Ktedonosporobacter sp.]